MENGDVYTFGYGQHGQLGHGDVNSRYSDSKVANQWFADHWWSERSEKLATSALT